MDFRRWAQAGWTLAGATALALPVTARAAGRVEWASDVFVERLLPGPDGRAARVLERAANYRAGDRLIFVVNWKTRHDQPFTLTNAMPRTIAFQRSAAADEEVSIDGGRSWGRLDLLRVREADGRVRHAVPEDVTHLRWRVPTRLAALGAGQITYRGIVR